MSVRTGHNDNSTACGRFQTAKTVLAFSVTPLARLSKLMMPPMEFILCSQRWEQEGTSIVSEMRELETPQLSSTGQRTAQCNKKMTYSYVQGWIHSWGISWEEEINPQVMSLGMGGWQISKTSKMFSFLNSTLLLLFATSLQIIIFFYILLNNFYFFISIYQLYNEFHSGLFVF